VVNGFGVMSSLMVYETAGLGSSPSTIANADRAAPSAGGFTIVADIDVRDQLAEPPI
jgi:hypothetical protein